MVRKIVKFLTSRLFIVSILILVQILIILAFVFTLSRNYAFVAGGFWFFSLVIVVVIINKQTNPVVKLPWILLITLMPVFGVLLYMKFGSSKLKKKDEEILQKEKEEFKKLYDGANPHLQTLRKQDPFAASQVSYINTVTDMPLCTNTDVTYFSLGEEMFEALVKELAAAKHYIFMEYFVVAPGFVWNTVLDILIHKVAEGLDVRFMYDDVGSVGTLPYRYNKLLEQSGIHCVAFNPYRATLKTILHNRDHRKITVIDGKTAFTGGINLADEYVNRRERFGHWKDGGIMLKGEAAFSFSLMFLELWGLYRGMENDYAGYLPAENYNANGKGFVQPYSDTPMDTEHVGELVYLNVINQATDYLYITTPYLIIDNELVTALELAAKRKVDVRIITPAIPDKWLVHELTCSYYGELLAAGVRIYQYTPGFMHSKNFVTDDRIATVGTINLDFRSLYHHYECGVWMYGTDCIKNIKADFVKTLEVCEEFTRESVKKTKVPKRLVRAVFKIFAPLL